MGVFISAVRFNHDSRSAEDGALNLRRSGLSPVRIPEWQVGSTWGPQDAPAAYSLADTLGRKLVIHAEFRRIDPGVSSVEIRAVPAGSTGWPGRPAYLPEPQLVWPRWYWFTGLPEYLTYLTYSEYYRLWQASFERSPTLLGQPKARVVTFGSDGSTGLVPFELEDSRLHDHGVGVEDISWQWQCRVQAAAPWVDMARTEHRIYVVLASPTEPWTQQPATATNHALPWTSVLDLACRWATGATTRDEAASAVTRAIFRLGTDRTLEYGCPLGAPTMYSLGQNYEYFDLAAFLERVDGGPGWGPFVNCTDCATAVATFANALGCDLWQSRMGTLTVPFLTNRIRAIGSDEFESPCGWGLGFLYHEVAWTGRCGVDDSVFDACLEVLEDPLVGPDEPPAPLLPTGMRFGESGDGQYRDRIAAPSSRAMCGPLPAARIRRKILPPSASAFLG